MEQIVDYTKYTLALAAALLVYLPANFIPAPSPVEHWALIIAVLLLVVSAIAGILLFARATTIVVKGLPATADPLIAKCAWIHQGFLVLAFLIAGYFFFVYKVWAPVAPAQCAATLSTPAGNPVQLTFPCSPG